MSGVRALVVALLAVVVPAGLSLSQAGTTSSASPRIAGSYRNRLLGVFDAQSGEPLESVQVADLKSGSSSLTTASGTVSLAFLPDGGSLVRLRKVGYDPLTLVVAISPADTAPLTLLLTPTAQPLPGMVTKDSARKYISPNLQGFEERRKAGFGHFIDETELRKREGDVMSNILLEISGINMKGGLALTSRMSQPGPALLSGRGNCFVTVYEDGVLIYQVSTMKTPPPNFSRISVDTYAGIEFYAGAATYPPWVSTTGNPCGVLLLWTRER